MKRVGAICDLEFTKHAQFRSYYYSLLALYGEVKLVKNITDLYGVDILVIGCPDHGPHIDVYSTLCFIQRCNELKITIVLISVEKIFGSKYIEHLQRYELISKCNKLVHYTYDIEDSKKLNTKLFRVCLSKHYEAWITIADEKKDAMVFCGVMYSWRKTLIDELRKYIWIDVPERSDFRNWEDYLRLIGSYRYVLSPIGDANAFVAKFYEILLVNSIPVHQVKYDTLLYYDKEAKFKDCIFFENVNELVDKLSFFTLKSSQSTIWMEDELGKLLKEDNLL
jgi:hypothetical protein